MTKHHKTGDVSMCPDSQNLEPLGGVIGCVREVNGSGAFEVPGFTPTRFEVEQILRLWIGIAVDHDYVMFATATVGNAELRADVLADAQADIFETQAAAADEARAYADADAHAEAQADAYETTLADTFADEWA